MRTFSLICVVTILLISLFSVAFPEVPQIINFQGLLTDTSNDPVVDGTYSVTFTIYDASSDGNSKWSETQNITTSNGLFGVMLGTINPIVDTVFNEPNRFLGITVDTDPELTPRTMILSVPYSYRVSSVDGASGGIINGNVTIGENNTNEGDISFVLGRNSISIGSRSTISGGAGNIDSSDYNSTIGGGIANKIRGSNSTIAGGSLNQINGVLGFIGGGENNIVDSFASTICGGLGNKNFSDLGVIGGGMANYNYGNFSTIVGGYRNTIAVMADYSYLFGIESNLTEDSTLMVDMPHIRFGDEVTGYEFPENDGTDGQVLATDGSGQLSWSDVSGTGNSSGMVPIGSITAWCKSLSGVPQTLPDNFVECNGQTISDPESPLNGVSIPSMNGRFLRGNSTSGNTGGSDNHSHTISNATTGYAADIQYDETGRMSYIGGNRVNLPSTQSMDTQQNIPPYYDVVWIMRIK